MLLYNCCMENERLIFEQVCKQYEFAAWELAELVERGDIHIVEDAQGKQWFEITEIERFFLETPYLISMVVAEFFSKRSGQTLRQQARIGKLKAKKVGGGWFTTLKVLNEYLEQYSRNV